MKSSSAHQNAQVHHELESIFTLEIVFIELASESGKHVQRAAKVAR